MQECNWSIKQRLNCQDDEVWKSDYQYLEQGCSYDYSSCEWPHPPSFAFNPMMLLRLTKACVQRLQISSVQLRTCTVTTPRGYYALQLSRECHEFILPPALAPWTPGNPYHPDFLRTTSFKRRRLLKSTFDLKVIELAKLFILYYFQSLIRPLSLVHVPRPRSRTVPYVPPYSRTVYRGLRMLFHIPGIQETWAQKDSWHQVHGNN